MLGISQNMNGLEHHHMSPSMTSHQGKSVDANQSVIKSHNLFTDMGEHLYNFMMKQVLRAETQSSILNLEN